MARYLLTLARPTTMASCVLLFLPALTAAQVPTGTISGRVTDSGGGVIQGATVSITSASLQGRQTQTTSDNGDYIFRSLPPGLYTLTVDRTGFAPTGQSVRVAPSETVPVNLVLSPAGVTENVAVVTSDDTSFVNTVQAAANLPFGLINTLPTARTLESYINIAPGAHSTGPDGDFTVAGGMSFENLFLVNGAVISDNIRNSPLPLFIEDALQEVTVATSGISAEYGRFSGGVINAVTRSGGNTFSGSYRIGMENDDWRTVTPFDEPKIDKIIPTHTFTLGGPVIRDRFWFFGAGRFEDRETGQQTAETGIPYTRSSSEERYEGNFTLALPRAHRLKVGYFRVNQEGANSNTAAIQGGDVMDLRSLISRRDPQSLATVNYTGTIGTSLAFEGQYSGRRWTIKDAGGRNPDRIEGTPIWDLSTGFTFWAPAFCGFCDDSRDNDNMFLKGSYFKSTAVGAHNVIFGYDTFNDRRKSDNRQSGTDYWMAATATNKIGTDLFPVLNAGSLIVHWPLDISSQGTNFRTHSLFLQDRWAANANWSFELGLRYDANRGKNGQGQLVADGSLVSPRLGLVFDPVGDGRTTINASYSRYADALANSIANSSSSAGTPAILVYQYLGPEFNGDANAPQVPTAQVMAEAFAWFDANRNNPEAAPLVQVTLPGVAVQIQDSLKSPHADEFAIGLSRQIGSRGAIRLDVRDRRWDNFYTHRLDTTTGTVMNSAGEAFDLTLVENTDIVERRYTGMTLLGTYRASRADLGVSYTLSKLRGNVDGENIGSGPLPEDGLLRYPEYSDAAWTAPIGDLSADQRHRARLWGTFTLPMWSDANLFSVGVLQSIESGTPYGAAANIALLDEYVTNPGYLTPPDRTVYYFTDRDEFRTETMYRTDVSLNVQRRFGSAARGFEAFAQFHLLNLFNQFQAFNLSSLAIDTTVDTFITDPSGPLVPFNPFTETPVRGTHWELGENFGKVVDDEAYTLPRTFRFSVGLRF